MLWEKEFDQKFIYQVFRMFSSQVSTLHVTKRGNEICFHERID